MARKKLSKEEKKQIRKEQRQKDALRSYRCRGFKNFLFWLTGVLTSVVLIITALFAGVAIIPVRVYLGNSADGIVSNDVSSKSLINAILKANTYDMSDFPIVADALDDFVKSAGLEQYVEIDVEKIKTLKFDETFTTELSSCIKVVATLESVGGAELIGDIGKLEVFSGWDEVESENLPVVDGEGNLVKDSESGNFVSNPKLYYYDKNDVKTLSAGTKTDGDFARAFDDNGNRVPGTEGCTLYYANLSRVPVLDLVDLIDESLGRLKLTDLLTSFGGAEFGDDSLVGNILGNKTISQLGEITGEDIVLTTILPYEDNAEIYKILLQVCGAEIENWDDVGAVKAAAESLNINSFGNLSFENVALATFLPYEDNAEIYKILLQICGVKIENWDDTTLVKAEAEKLNINSFGNLNFETLSLATFLPYEDNAEIYKILLQVCGVKIENWEDVDAVKAEAEKLNINSFANLNFENLSLTTFLPYEDNADIYKILLQICGVKIENWDDVDAVKAEAEKLGIDSFSNLSLENVSLTTLLPYEDNADIYKMLLQICGVKIENWDDADAVKAEAEKLGINSFSNLSLENVSLTTFLPYEENVDTYKLLLQVCGVTIENWDDADAVKAEAEKLNINSFSNLSLENVTLTTLLPYGENADLYKILLQMCGNDLTGLGETEIEELAKTLDIDSFTSLSFENITLTTFLPYGENADLYKILLQMCGNDLTGLSESEIEELAKTLDINSFGSLEFENVSLTTFLPYKDAENGVDNSAIYKILLQACGYDLSELDDDSVALLAKELNVNSFEKLDFNNISIDTFGIDIDTAKILIEAVNAKITEDNNNLKPGETPTPLLNDVSDLTVSHLTMLDPDYIKLSSLLPYSSNADLYKIILQACGNDLTGLNDTAISNLANGLNINAFGDIDFNNVTISTFGLGGETLDLLLNAINGKIAEDNAKPGAVQKPLLTAKQLTVAHLLTLDTNYITLSSVLPYSGNAEMYKIILQACGNDLTGLDDTAISNLADKLSISAFNDIDFNKVSISTFGLGGQTLDLLLNAVNGKIIEDNAKPGAVQKPLLTAEQLTVGHLLTLDTNYITLSSVLSYDSNKDMYKIILQACGNDLTGLDDTAISNLASKLSISAFNDIDFNKVSISTFGIQGNTLTLLFNAVNGKIAEDNAKPGAVQKPLLTSESQLTVNHLISFDANYIKLSTVLPYEDENKQPLNTALYNILLDVINGETGTKTAGDITVSDLTSFNTNSIKLNNVMPKTAENQALYEILLDVINSDKKAGDIGYLTYDKITINCLTKFSFDNVKLWHVLPYENQDGVSVNTALYSILLDVINGETGTKTAKDIKISDLSTFSFEMVRLSTVMPKTDSNAGLYNILLDIINGDKAVGDAGYVNEGAITISDLSTFNVVGIKLNTVMPKTDSNASLYNVLLDVINGDKKAGDSGYVSFDNITINNLSSFSFENVKLSTVLPYQDKNGVAINSGLYSVLLDVINSGKSESEKLTNADLKISHLSSFSVTNIRLQTVLGNGKTGNVILDKLIEKDVAVSGLATAINGLSLYEIYGQNCFVEYKGETNVARYKKADDSYILDENGEYVISKTAGIWLFLCFDSTGVVKTAGNAYGCAEKYVVSNATLQTLTAANSGANLSSKITSATIRQLVDAGILSTAHQDIYTMTLNDIATSEVWKYLAYLPK